MVMPKGTALAARVILVAFGLFTAAHATPYSGNPVLITFDSFRELDPAAEWIFSPGPNVFFGSNQVTSYDATGDLFTFSADVVDLWQSEDRYVGSVATDFSFQANVNDAGEVGGGSVVWVGGIPDLGVGDGTTLLEGNVIDGAWVSGSSWGRVGFDFVIEVTDSLDLLGFGPYVGFHDNAFPVQDWFDSPWSECLVAADHFTDSELGSVNRIPEPASLALVAIGLAAIGLGRGRRRERRRQPERQNRNQNTDIFISRL